MSFRIARVQQKAAPGEPEENIRRGVRYIQEAKAQGADLVLFPEMWSNAYAPPFEEAWDDPFRPDREKERCRWRKQAVTPDGVYVSAFREAARASGIGVCITCRSTGDAAPRNTALIIGRNGEILLRYDKVHTCAFSMEALLEPGDAFRICTFDGVKLGVMICYDREFPESARILMLKGAEVILVPNACPMEINRISQLRARAFENMTGIATVNYPYGKPDCNGHSTAFDGIAYRENEPGSRDTLIIEAGEGEGIYMASFPMEELRAYRQSEVHGNAYRRPEKYHLLISREIREPFIRADRRGEDESND